MAVLCDDDVPMYEPYSMIGTASTLPKDETYVPVYRPIGFIWATSADVGDGDDSG